MHATGESVNCAVPRGTHAVVLAAKTSTQLNQISDKLKLANVEHCLIIENDEPYVGELLAIGIQPQERTEVKRHLSSLPLLK